MPQHRAAEEKKGQKGIMDNQVVIDAINKLIYFMPYMFAFALLYLLVSFKGGRKSIYKANVIALISMGIILTVFYVPHSQLLETYQFKNLEVRIGEGPSKTIMDQDTVNRIVAEINRHQFIRSAFKTVKQQNFAGENLIWLGLHDTNGKGVFLLYLERNSIDCTLRGNGQDYNVWDKQELIEKIETYIEEAGVHAGLN